METEMPEFGIAGVVIPIQAFDEGLFDYSYEKSNGETIFYLLKLLRADKDAQYDKTVGSLPQEGRE